MIESLKYSVVFPTNGVTLTGNLSFQPGITAITGKNGQGKTFAGSELIRYILFGKKALRGPASDYKTLEAEATLLIRNERFTVIRGKKESVTDSSGKIVAVKAEAVTNFLVEKLGFDLDVFDVICSARQKDSERLSRMKPAERKRMIDDIVGLSQNEAVESECRKEASQLRRDAETLRDTIVPVFEPQKPESYEPSAVLEQKLSEARAVERRRAELQQLVAAAGPEPVEPDDAPALDVEDLETHENERTRRNAEHDALKRQIAAIPDATHTAEELALQEQWLNYHDELERRGRKPLMDRTDAEAMLEAWGVYNALRNQERHKATCPKCEHEFETGLPVPPEPAIPARQLREELEAHDKWSTPLLPPSSGHLQLTRAELTKAKAALVRQDEKGELQTRLGEIELLEDRSAALLAARRLDAQWSAYATARSRWEDRLEAAQAASEELSQLPPAVDVDALHSALTAARVYETQLDHYIEGKARAEKTEAEAAAKIAKADSFKEGAEALKRARGQFKAFLAPSLGRVASALIAQMTNGAFSSVVVDEDMNIAVDGQDVGTMSGAQATLANLALRLALGQILTAKVFPVFLGDEIDSDCDDEWAPAVAEALGRLKSQLKQIILISHKSFDWADNHIRIGQSSELPE